RHTRCLSDWSSDVCSSDLCSAPSRAVHPGRTERDHLLRTSSRPRTARASTGTSVLAPRTVSYRGDASPPYRTPPVAAYLQHSCRSEERRVGKESRTRVCPY